MMMKTMRQTAAALAFVLALGSAAAPARAQESAPLLRAVPADVHFYTHGTTPQTPDPATLAFGRMMSSLCESGIHRDILDLVSAEVPEEARARIAAAVDEALRLLGGVDWNLLVERESAFAFRLGVPMPEYLILFRVPRDEAPKQVAALKDMLSGLIAMTGMTPSVQEAERTSGKMTLISLPGVPVQLAMGAVGDAIVVATSANLGASAMSKLAGGTDEGSILGSESAKKATGGLPQSRYGVEYVDLDAMLSFVGQMLGMAGTMMPSDGSADTDKARQVIGLALAVLQDVNIIDSVATSYSSDAKRSTMVTRLTFRPEAGQSRLAAIAGKQRPWTDWAKRVPKDATSFSFSPGADLAALYDWALALVKENLSMQEEVLGKWKEIQSQIGVDVREDVLALFSGESATVSFPALPDGSPTGESVTFIRLEQPDRVAAKLKHVLDAGAAYVASRGHKVDLVSRGALTEIRIAPLPWMKVVVGVLGDELVIGSSAAAVAKIEKVTRGAEPNILAEPRFAALGIGTREGLQGVGYWSVDASLAPFADVLGAVGFFYSLMPEDRETKQIIVLGRILCKVAAGLREIDLHYDQAYETVTTADGASESRVVTGYR